MAEPTTHQPVRHQPPCLCVRHVGPSGRPRTLGLRQAALMIGHLAAVDHDVVWLDLRAGHSFEVGDDTFVPLRLTDFVKV